MKVLYIYFYTYSIIFLSFLLIFFIIYLEGFVSILDRVGGGVLGWGVCVRGVGECGKNVFG